MARSKNNSSQNDYYQDFDEFDERTVENSYGVKIKNISRTPKKTKKIKFDGDNIEWWVSINTLWKTIFPQVSTILPPQGTHLKYTVPVSELV